VSKFLIQATWDDVPHLDPQAKAELLAAYPPYQRDARTKGIPQLGSGAIYQVPESDVVVPDFEIPDYYPRCYGMDVGWNRTAVVWGAKDPASNTIYLYSEHYRGQAEPIVHALAIQSRGKWIPGVIDPASAGRSQKDGMQLLMQYKEMGLDLEPASNTVESGIQEVWQLLSALKLRVFRSLGNWITEFRLYQRDTDGRIVKQHDHLMDACLAPDTLIQTNLGHIAIKDLITVKGWVLSRSGSWARFHGARKTIENARVVRVKFADDSEVLCTPDHPFLTPDGWMPAMEMPGRYVYNGLSQCQTKEQFSGTIQSWFRQPAKCFRESASIFAESIISMGSGAYACIDGCGKPGMANLFQLASTYITPTTAVTTTGTTTSSLWQEPGMWRTIIKVLARSFQQQRFQPQPSGMAAMLGESGTKPTTTKWEPGCTLAQNSLASTAVSPTSPESPEQIDSVPATAELGFAKRLAWTIRNIAAWSVAHVLWRIATSGNSAARASALLNVLSVEEAGKSDVYCLTVPGTSAFCLSNGAVVHNTRYLIVSGRDRMRQAPAKAKHESRYVYPGQQSQAWME
jgi:hypothetical protein